MINKNYHINKYFSKLLKFMNFFKILIRYKVLIKLTYEEIDTYYLIVNQILK
jgi:hypothetical protein